MNIVFAASECVPFAKTGGLADVVGALPKALVDLGHRVSVYLPHYDPAKNVGGGVLLRRVAADFGDRLLYCSVVDGGLRSGVQFYLIDSPPLFQREGLYGTKDGDYPDNAQRFALYARAALEASRVFGVPDIFHCHDWQAALVPILLRTVYADDPLLQDAATVFTIHNMGYQGLFPPEMLPALGLPWDLFTMDKMEFWGKVNFLKGALTFSDHITTVSKKYSQEIQTPEYGFGLDGVLRERASRVSGILNGVDYSEWSPEADAILIRTYGPHDFAGNDLEGKKECKRDLLRQFGLDRINLDLPVVGVVSRFAAQKGFDLIAEAADELADLPLVMTILGSGDREYENLFRRLNNRFPEKFLLKVGYDNALAHKIEAGADMFLMPSRYEPSGLNQMYSLKYGAVPIVRATGGLDDSIEPWNPATGQGTGFKFSDYSGAALLEAVRGALRAFGDQASWRKLMLNGMSKDFSWTASAREYAKIYEQVKRNRAARAA